MKIEKLDGIDTCAFLYKINEIVDFINMQCGWIIPNTEQPSQEYGYVQALRSEVYAYLNNGDPLQKIEQWKMRNGVMDIFEKYREKNEPAPLSHDKGLEGKIDEILVLFGCTVNKTGHVHDEDIVGCRKAILSHLEKKV